MTVKEYISTFNEFLKPQKILELWGQWIMENHII